MSEEIKECIEDLLTVACCPEHDESCKNVYNYVIEIQEQDDKKQQVIDKIKEYAGELRLFDNESVEFEISTKLFELLEEIE